MLNNTDPKYIEFQEQYHKGYKNQIGCYVPEIKKSEVLKIWRKFVEVDIKTEIRISVYKKVFKYATQWKEVNWAPNFYEIIEVLDYIKILPISEFPHLTTKQYNNAMIVTKRTAQVIKNPYKISKVENNYINIQDSQSPSSSLNISYTEYKFSTIKSEIVMSANTYCYYQGDLDKITEIQTQQFLTECELMVESKTEIINK